MRRHPQNLTLWCFDLLHLNNKDLRSKPLAERRRLLQTLIERTDHPDLRYSEAFTDAAKLLAKANELKLEGTVLKRTNQIYKSGRNPGWLKIKTPYWYAHGRK
jgi:bifunctional non-homologous end joining protein LigD